MNFKTDNKTILKKLETIIHLNPNLNFQQLLHESGCCPVGFINDVSNPKIGQHAIIDRRKEDSNKTICRMNKTSRTNTKKECLIGE